LIFETADDLAPLAVVRFSFRQKIIMGHLKFAVEEKIKDCQISFHDLNADDQYQSSVLKPIFDAQNNVEGNKSNTLWRLLSYLKPYRKELIYGSIGAVCTTLVSLVPAYISGRLIDDTIKPYQDGVLTLGEASKIAWLFVITLAVTFLLREVFTWLRLNKMSVMGEKVARDLREQLYSHLQTLGLDFYSKKHSGSLISRVSSDTDRIWDFVAFGVVEVGIAIIALTSLSVVLMTMDLMLGLTLALPVPLFLFMIYHHGEKMQKLFLKAWRKWSTLTSVLSDTIPGMQVVKAFNQEEREKSRFNVSNEDALNSFDQIHHVWTRFWPVLMLSVHAAMMFVWAFAVPRLLNDESSSAYLSAGTFVSFLLYMTMFTQPIEVIGQVARMLNRALSSAYRIFEVLDTKPTLQNSDEPKQIERISGDVEFSNVHFSYDGVRPIINNLSFKVKAGEMIGLVGSSGGGKSTITKLLARFYDVNSGRIYVDGIPLKDLDVGKFRRQVGMVLQDPYLFHGTIWENISYGLPDADKKAVIEAAKVANAHEFILNMPQAYDTVIGERGHTLSGGERQRVSIARAVLCDPKILILDEATSAVDTETERKIQDALDKLVVGRTVFAVAHRLSTLRKADRIFVIKKGEIVEEGTHEKLLADKEGEYTKLHRMQQEMSEGFLKT
jgi:ATP-binding cassette subfamily B protein